MVRLQPLEGADAPGEHHQDQGRQHPQRAVAYQGRQQQREQQVELPLDRQGPPGVRQRMSPGKTEIVGEQQVGDGVAQGWQLTDHAHGGQQQQAQELGVIGGRHPQHPSAHEFEVAQVGRVASRLGPGEGEAGEHEEQVHPGPAAGEQGSEVEAAGRQHRAAGHQPDMEDEHPEGGNAADAR